MYKINTSKDEPEIEDWMNGLEKEGYKLVSTEIYSTIGSAVLVVIMHKDD